MAENQKRARPGRKPNTPSLDSIRQAVARGEYDDYLNDLTRMIQNRRDELKKTVMARVREVFGPDATVVEGNSEPSSKPDNPPDPHNPFVKKAEQEESDSEQSESDPMAQLDEVERKMEEEGRGPEPAATLAAAQVDIERRGASISGLHSSDMGGP